MPVFRWIPEEEAWLEARVIADDGQSDTNNKQWLRKLVADFQNTFLFIPRRNPGGMMETRDELAARWKDIPRVCTLLFLLQGHLMRGLLGARESNGGYRTTKTLY